MNKILIVFLVLGSASVFASNHPDGPYVCEGGGRVQVSRDSINSPVFRISFEAGGARGTLFRYAAEIDQSDASGWNLKVDGFDIGRAGRLIPRDQLRNGYIKVNDFDSKSQTFSFKYQDARITYRSSDGQHYSPDWSSFDWESNVFVSDCKKTKYYGCAGGNCN